MHSDDGLIREKKKQKKKTKRATFSADDISFYCFYLFRLYYHNGFKGGQGSLLNSQNKRTDTHIYCTYRYKYTHIYICKYIKSHQYNYIRLYAVHHSSTSCFLLLSLTINVHDTYMHAYIST